MILATGATYRRLEVDEIEALALSGAGVFYGGPATEAPAMAGRDVRRRRRQLGRAGGAAPGRKRPAGHRRRSCGLARRRCPPKLDEPRRLRGRRGLDRRHPGQGHAGGGATQSARFAEVASGGSTRDAETSSPGRSLPLGHNDAEAIIEAVAILDRDRLREATCGDGEVIEKADVAEQDQAEAVLAIDEADRRFPFALCAGIVVVVQAQGDGLVVASAPVSTSPSNSGVDASFAARETGTNGRNTGCPNRVC